MPIAIRRSLVLVAAASLVATMMAVLAPQAQAHEPPKRTYRVTVENLTSNQTITPAVVAAHDRRTHIFRIGRAASHGIQQLAENGGVPVLVDELEHTKGVKGVAVAGSEPIGPGESAEVVISAPGSSRRLTVAAMLICTNDGFASATNVRLPSAFGKARSVAGGSYDAGTEVNTERYADLVPPCDGMGATATTNPDLAENGVVRRHAGIQGVGDLTAAANGWWDPTIRVTAERVRVFEIGVRNLTTGQLTTPFVAATHRRSGAIFRPGRSASPGLQALAENGGVPTLAAELEGTRRVGTVAVVGDGPIPPGGSASTSVVVADRYARLSVAGMLICTNDGFGGVNSLRLPRHIGDSVTVDGDAYDAGTEVNTELYADLVPPCDAAGMSGMSDPTLAENGVVRAHDGITAGGDLSQATHGWDDPVIEVTVTRIR